MVRTEYKGDAGSAFRCAQHFGNIRVRMVAYKAGYFADHWCSKSHVLFCHGGKLHTELADGQTFKLTLGTSDQAADNAESHRSSTEMGAKLFIVD